MSRRALRRVVWPSSLVVGCMMLPAHAAWVVDPSASVSSSYEDNVRLEPTNEDEAVVTTGTAQARISNVREASEISGVIGLNYLVYSGAEDLEDSDTWFVDLSGSRSFERMRAALTTSVRRDVILRRANSIPEDFEPGDLDDGSGFAGPGSPEDDFISDIDIDDNVVREQIDRTRISASPSLGYSFSERTRGQIGLNYFGLRYGDNPNQIQDSDRYGVFASIDRELSPRDTLQLRVQASKFEPEITQETDDYEATLRWSRRASERLSFGVEVGARVVDGSDALTSTGSVVRVNGTYRTLTGRLTGSLERSVLPSAFGDLTEADRVNLAYVRSFGARVNFRLAARAFETRRDGGNNNRDRQFFLIEPSFNWDLTPAWSVSTGYEFRWTERENQSGSAQGNTVTLGIVYRPPSRL